MYGCEKGMTGGGSIVAICMSSRLVRVCSDNNNIGWDVHFLCAALTVWQIVCGSGKVRERCDPGMLFDIGLD
jgi:hypothetical protein